MHERERALFQYVILEFSTAGASMVSSPRCVGKSFYHTRVRGNHGDGEAACRQGVRRLGRGCSVSNRPGAVHPPAGREVRWRGWLSRPVASGRELWNIDHRTSERHFLRVSRTSGDHNDCGQRSLRFLRSGEIESFEFSMNLAMPRSRRRIEGKPDKKHHDGTDDLGDPRAPCHV